MQHHERVKLRSHSRPPFPGALTSGARMRGVTEPAKQAATPQHYLIMAVSLALAALHTVLFVAEVRRGGNAVALFAFGVAMITDVAALLTLLFTRSLRATGYVLVLGLSAEVVLSGIAGGGLRSASMPIIAAIPLLATFVGGRVAGVTCAAALAGYATLLYAFDDILMRTGTLPASESLGATAFGLIVTLVLVGALAYALQGESASAQEELERSERRFRLLGQHTADVVFVHDAEGVILDVNDRAVEGLGIGRAALVLGGVQSFERGPNYLAALRGMEDRRVLALERTYRRPDGSEFPVDVRVSRFDGEGRKLFLASARDVSGRHDAEIALRMAKEEAERANKAKSRFLANLSHEMRTPLNTIIGFARVLHRGTFGPLAAQQERFVGNILEAGEHMLTLVNNLLDYRRLEEGHSSVELEPLAVQQALGEALTLVRGIVDERRHSLHTTLPEDLPRVIADRQALVRILTNLLTNACKYTDDHGTITVSATSDDDTVTVAVSDTGIGIAPSDHERVFNYFEQVNNRLAKRSAGSGVGLALSRQLARRLGGDIRVESQLGHGSTFRLTLGRADPPMMVSGPSRRVSQVVTP